MKKQFVIPPSMPYPARMITTAIQSLLRVSRSEAEKIIHGGYVSVNGRLRTHAHGTLEVGDELEVEHIVRQKIPLETKKSARSPIEILYEDEQILVVCKPSHLLTVPTPHREKNTLQSFLTKRLQKEKRNAQAFCVHRLDRGVSGLLVFAKDLETAESLRSQFARRKPQRKYVAIVRGEMKDSRGTIRSFLATDAELNRYSVKDGEGGELAITHFEVTHALKGASILQIKLETGRRNQIRVHMAEKGHPILGDPRYGREESPSVLWPYQRIALHAESLGFTHPETGEDLQFVTSWPEEFRAFKRKCRSKSE